MRVLYRRRYCTREICRRIIPGPHERAAPVGDGIENAGVVGGKRVKEPRKNVLKKQPTSGKY